MWNILVPINEIYGVFLLRKNQAFALRVEPLASLNRHAADYQSLTRRHALRIRLFCPVHRKTEYRFSEREGWHLGTPTPRPQETGWHSLRPQGPRRRLGVVVAGGNGLHRDHPPGTRCTFSRAPGGVVRPPGTRPPRVGSRRPGGAGARWPSSTIGMQVMV